MTVIGLSHVPINESETEREKNVGLRESESIFIPCVERGLPIPLQFLFHPLTRRVREKESEKFLFSSPDYFRPPALPPLLLFNFVS